MFCPVCSHPPPFLYTSPNILPITFIFLLFGSSLPSLFMYFLFSMFFPFLSFLFSWSISKQCNGLCWHWHNEIGSRKYSQSNRFSCKSFRCHNTAQRFVTLKDRILQLWKVITTATVFLLGCGNLQIKSRNKVKCIFTIQVNERLIFHVEWDSV